MASPTEKKKKGFKSSFKNKFKQITGIPLELQRPVGAGHQKPSKEVDEVALVLKKVYHMGYPTCSNYAHNTGNCKDNPKCIKGLGEGTGGIWKAEKDLGTSPEKSLRPEGKQYIGLRNLGATCYINSLLQSLFMNRNFRNAVYQYQGDDKLCRQLQILFAQLQESRKDYCSPKEITNLLNIQTSVHQDVQEFNNLFMSLLESKFKKCENVQVQNFIKNEFSGVNRYETRCKQCGNISARDTPFNELELTIPGGKSSVSLSTCLKALVKEETLSGDNKYDCESCGLVDAVRRVKLISLPPVLNFQLLRFVYDPVTYAKKKLSTMISFPRVLDLSGYVNREKSECVYELTAVLLHLGSSASAGHYIAHIQDEVTKQWWKFDDSSVTRLDPKEVGDIETPVGPDNIVGTREKAKSLISGLKKNPKISSANAYMLIYSRKENRMGPDPVPPQEALNYVERTNKILMEKLSEWQTRQSELRLAISSHQESYKEFMKLSKLVPHEPYNWIDAKWLATWISGEYKINAITYNTNNTNNTEETASTETHITCPPLDNSAILCPHDRVDPRNLHRTKIINAKAWDYLAERVEVIGPLLDGSCLCFDCAAEIYERNALAQGRQAEVHRIIREAYAFRVQEGYWVPEEWLKEWKEVAVIGQLAVLDPIITRGITCEHGEMTWKKSERRLIKTEVWSYLRSTFPEGPEYPKDQKPCRICEEINEQRVAIARERKLTRTKQKYALPSLTKSLYLRDIVTATYYVLPISWQKDWYIYVSRPTLIDNLDPPRMDSLLCEHGMMKYNPIELIDYCINPKVATRVITSGEWEKIAEFYGKPESEIKLDLVRTKKDEIEVSQCSPPFCDECIALQHMQDIEDQMNYSSAKIWIEIPGSSTLETF